MGDYGGGENIYQVHSIVIIILHVPPRLLRWTIKLEINFSFLSFSWDKERGTNQEGL